MPATTTRKQTARAKAPKLEAITITLPATETIRRALRIGEIHGSTASELVARMLVDYHAKQTGQQ